MLLARSRDGTVMLIISGTVAETSLFVFGIISRGLVGRFSLDIFPVLAPLPWPSLNETVLDVQPMCPLFYRPSASDDGSLFIWNLEPLKETKGSANCVEGISSSLVLTAVRSNPPPPLPPLADARGLFHLWMGEVSAGTRFG